MHRTVAAHLASALATSLLFVSSITAHAQTTRNVPAAYPTIQSAINAAATGDTVLVAPGIYPESIDFTGKAITVISSGGAGNTIIDGTTHTTAPAVQFATGEGRASVLQGFTIRGGGGTATAPADPSGNAGGIYLFQTAPTIQNNTITQNTCYGVHATSSAPLLQNNIVSATAWTTGAPCTTDSGSGVWLNGGGGPANNGLVPMLVGNTIQNNILSGQNNPNTDGGAAISLLGVSNPIIERNTLSNNTTAGIGGAILMLNSDSIFLVDNVISGNQAQYGGAFVVLVPSFETGIPSAVLSNNTVVDNTTAPGSPSIGTVSDAQFLLLGGTGRFVVANNIISSTSASTAAVSCLSVNPGDTAVPPAIEYNDAYNTAGGPAFAGSPGCVSQAGAFGNITTDPLFSNRAAGNYQLLTGSPAIDTGNTSVEIALLPVFQPLGLGLPPDFLGNARVVDATGKGYPIIDMGAYEFQGTADAPINSLFLTANTYHIAGGQTVTFEAALFTSAQTPSLGTVTLTQTNPDGTTHPYTGQLATSGTSTAAFITTAALAPGLYSFIATYPATAGASPATSIHVYILVDPYSDSLTLTSSTGNNPSLFGQPVTFTATLSSANGIPPGDLTLLIDGTTITSLTPNPSTGVATYTTSTLTPGSHTVEVDYAGTALYAPATATLTQVVTGGYTTTTTLGASPAPTAPFGQTILFTATVTNTVGNGQPVPAGTVQFLDGTTVLAAPTLSTTGTATFSTGTLTPGQHTITANYITAPQTPPAAPFAPSSNSLVETITGQPTATALSATPNPALALTPVTLTAAVTVPSSATVATGTITFFDNTAVLGTAPLNAAGQATFTTSQLTAGTHPLHAVYSGTSTLAGSTSPVYNEVINANQTSTTLQVTPASSPAYQPVLLNTHTSSGVAGTPVNTPAGSAPSVTFFANGTALGTSPVDSAGNAALTVNPVAGTYTVTAVFSGSGLFGGSTSNPVTLVVNPINSGLSLTGSPATVVVRQTVQLTAVLAAPGAPGSALTGTVTFSDTTAGAVLGVAPLANGVATLSFAPATPGAHVILAHFNGNGSLLPADATFTVTVTPQDFAIVPSSPSITIRTEHHATIAINVNTLGGLVDSIHLSCENLPSWTTCNFGPADIAVNTGPTVADTTTSTSQLYLDTDFVIGYAHLDRPAIPGPNSSGPSLAGPTLTSHTLASHTHPGSDSRSSGSYARSLAPIALAILCPAALFFGLGRRIRLPRLLLIAIVSVGVLSASGCSGLYPPHTAPGTYTITLVGHAANNNLTRTATLTLVVTQ